MLAFGTPKKNANFAEKNGFLTAVWWKLSLESLQLRICRNHTWRSSRCGMSSTWTLFRLAGWFPQLVWCLVRSRSYFEVIWVDLTYSSIFRGKICSSGRRHFSFLHERCQIQAEFDRRNDFQRVWGWSIGGLKDFCQGWYSMFLYICCVVSLVPWWKKHHILPCWHRFTGW